MSSEPTPHTNLPDVFQGQAESCYPLETTARLAGVERRTVLIYCRHGLIRPTDTSPSEARFFTDETVHTIRRLEELREMHGINLTGLRLISELQQRVERLESELRFLREAG